jgi:hypothetical protein
MLITLRRMRYRHRKQRLCDKCGRHGHVVRLRMIEECVLENHQQCKFDGKNDGYISAKRRAAYPAGEPRAQGGARWVPVVQRYGHDRSTDDFTPGYPAGIRPLARSGEYITNIRPGAGSAEVRDCGIASRLRAVVFSIAIQFALRQENGARIVERKTRAEEKKSPAVLRGQGFLRAVTGAGRYVCLCVLDQCAAHLLHRARFNLPNPLGRDTEFISEVVQRRAARTVIFDLQPAGLDNATAAGV